MATAQYPTSIIIECAERKIRQQQVAKLDARHSAIAELMERGKRVWTRDWPFRKTVRLTDEEAVAAYESIDTDGCCFYSDKWYTERGYEMRIARARELRRMAKTLGPDGVITLSIDEVHFLDIPRSGEP